MKTLTGDIWKLTKTHLIVVPTNIGWNSSGSNIMGKGLAKDAAERYPGIAEWYGDLCKKLGADITVVQYSGTSIILFPVKPFNKQSPWLSWKSKASLELIEKSAKELAEWPDLDPIAVPIVGCGAGGLDPSEVRPILERILVGTHFVLVTSDWGHLQTRIRELGRGIAKTGRRKP